MSNPDYQVFLNTDVLQRKNDIEWLGYPKTNTEKEMYILARRYGCKIITKNGYNGKWYLKGKGYSRDYLQETINQKRGNSREGVYCMLLS